MGVIQSTIESDLVQLPEKHCSFVPFARSSILLQHRVMPVCHELVIFCQKGFEWFGGMLHTLHMKGIHRDDT